MKSRTNRNRILRQLREVTERAERLESDNEILTRAAERAERDRRTAIAVAKEVEERTKRRTLAYLEAQAKSLQEVAQRLDDVFRELSPVRGMAFDGASRYGLQVNVDLRTLFDKEVIARQLAARVFHSIMRMDVKKPIQELRERSAEARIERETWLHGLGAPCVKTPIEGGDEAKAELAAIQTVLEGIRSKGGGLKPLAELTFRAWSSRAKSAIDKFRECQRRFKFTLGETYAAELYWLASQLESVCRAELNGRSREAVVALQVKLREFRELEIDDDSFRAIRKPWSEAEAFLTMERAVRTGEEIRTEEAKRRSLDEAASQAAQIALGVFLGGLIKEEGNSKPC